MQLEVVLMHTDSLSSFLQYHTSCYKGQKIVKVWFSTLQGMREEVSFDMSLRKMTPNYLENEMF